MRKKHKKLGLIMRFMPGALPWFIATILSSATVTLCDTIMPQIISVTVDSIIGEKDFTLSNWIVNLLGGQETLESLRGKLIVVAAAVIIVAVIAALARYSARVSNSRGSERYVKSIRDTLFSHIQKLPFSWHTKNRTGDIIQRCTSDVDQVRSFVTGQLIEVFRIVFQVGFSLFAMFAMDVKITLIAMAFVPFVFSYSLVFHKKITRRFKEADEAEGVLSTVAQENLTGVRVVRAFGRERYERDKFEGKNNLFTMSWVKLAHTLSWYWALSDFVSALQVLIVIVVGTIAAVGGSITPGQFIAFVSYNAMLSWPVRNLGRMVSEMSKAGVSIDRLNYILEAEEEKDRPNAVSAPLDRDIVFENVSFGYSEDRHMVRDVSFRIPAGSTFAILGGTGSGKSTLMHLLNRLYDLSEGGGRITIGGVDIADMKANELRGGIGMVLQEPFLFSRSIGDNISIALNEYSFDAVKEAAESACLSESIEEFSLKYDTIVGERGVTLSGGQKQRAAIARMLVKKAPIMVFDDSLSAVDTETDANIRAALKKHMSDSTVILISHRITTLMEADCILVLDEGRVAQIGNHQELVSREGIYKDVYDLQMMGAKEAVNG